MKMRQSKHVSNSALHRSLSALSHPITWAALAILLINDHLLRLAWPSWWTGKLGDFAWLFFAPFGVAAGLSLLVPPRWKNQSSLVGFLSFLGTGLVFGLAKTVPAFHDLIVRIASIAFQSPVSWQLDPSDLIAEVVILPAWWMWQRQSVSPLRLAVRGWVAIPLAGLLTIANSVAPTYGIYCLFPYQNQVIAFAGFSMSFTTNDGGLSWQPISWDELNMWPYCSSGNKFCTCALVTDKPGTCSLYAYLNQPGFALNPNDPQTCTLALNGEAGICTFPPKETHKTIVSPVNPAMKFQYQAGDSIKVSDDGGQIWLQEFHLTANEAQRDYLATNMNAYSAPSPLGGMVDPKTGNAIFAMGLEGILVYQPDTQTWNWVNLAGFNHKEINPLNLMFALIADEFFLGMVLGMLSFLVLTLTQERSAGKILLMVLAWIIWGIPAIFLRTPTGYDPYGMQTSMPVNVCIILSGLISLFLVLVQIKKIGWWGLKVFLVNWVIFIIPFILWTFGNPEKYETTRLIALILAGIALVIELVITRKSQPKNI